MKERRLHSLGALTVAMALTSASVLTACQESPPPALHGYVEAELLHVGPVSGGTLAQVAVQKGQRVSAGQLLFTMDATPEERQADAAAARSERASAQLDNLRTGRRPLELAALRQQVRQAEAVRGASSSALQRQRQLVEQGFVSAARLDELVAQQERDAARVRELQAQLDFAQQAARQDEIQAAAADSRAAQADADLAAWRRGQARRLAPRAAEVLDVVHKPGEVVAAGAPVVSLLPEGALKVLFFVPETQLPQAAVGRMVRVSCDGCAQAQQARIRWVSPQAEYAPPVLYSNEARAKLVFRVEAEPLASAQLRPGQPVDVRFDAGQAQ